MAKPTRPIASLTISFGLVAIPVKLFSATVASERIAFHWLRKKDGSRVKEHFVAAADGAPVERADMVKGYEFAKDKYVMFTPQELKALEDETSPSLDISQFVPLESVDPVYFSGTYYLAPDKGGAKPYALLATALNESKQCAVGRWTSRGKEHVIVIRPLGAALVLHQLHFRAEIRDVKDLGLESTKVSESELRLARQLIEHLAVKRFDPREYVDEHRVRVAAAIKRKAQGKEFTLSGASVDKPPSNVVSLLDALKASIEKRSGAALPARNAKRRAAPRKAARR